MSVFFAALFNVCSRNRTVFYIIVSWNWENTKVVETLNKILSTEIGDIEQNIKQQNIKFIEFAKDNYCSVFKNTYSSFVGLLTLLLLATYHIAT
jgi:hypothetical protein